MGFKMYKSGKFWLFSATALVGVGVVGNIAQDGVDVSTAFASESRVQYNAEENLLVNGNFENPVVKQNVAEQLPQDNVPGWHTTASDNLIEIVNGTGGGHRFKPSVGNQYAEINATQPGELFQVVKTKPGTIMKWSLDHAGRDQTDTMELTIKPSQGGTGKAPFTRQMSSPDRKWTSYEGFYEVGDDETSTYFGFKSISSLNPSYGNYLDNIVFTVYNKNPMLPIVKGSDNQLIMPSAESDEWKTMPPLVGEPGEKILVDPKNLPDIEGWDKPTEPFEVVIPQEPGDPIYVPYTEKTTPSRPVDENGKPIALPEGKTMPEVKGVPGDEAELDVKDLPDIPGYAKPQPDENGKVKVKIVDDGNGGKVYDVPYTQTSTPTRPVDKNTGEAITVPEGKTMPEVKGAPGEEVELDVNDFPDIPGYDKPEADENGKVKVKVPEDGKPIDVPYTPKSTPTRPVDEKGNPIDVPKDTKMPEVKGEPGDEVELDVNDLPDIPGYTKPQADENGKVKVKIVDDGNGGKVYDVSYTQTSTPTRPVDEKGNPIDVPKDTKMPEVKGTPGDEVELDVNDLPDIPGYDKPKGDENGKIKVKVPEAGKSIDVPYTEKTTPTRPVDEKGNPIDVPKDTKMPEVKGEPGDEAELDINDLPDIPGYTKPQADENGKVKIVDDGKGGKVYDVPYAKTTPTRPVDETTGEEIKLPEGKTMPELEGKPGDEVEIDVNDLPDIPGYDKPKGDENGKIKVKVPEAGKPVDVPYTEKTTPTRPVDKNTGEPITLPEGKTMPEVKGEPGDEVELDINDLPDIPGYAKPQADENGKVKVKIVDDGKGGKVYDVPYAKTTPTRPVDKNTGEEIKLPEGKTMPQLEGKPGDEVEIDVNDLPDIPGYDKPKGDENGKIKVKVPEAGKPVDVPYTPKKNTTPSRPVDKNTGKEIKTDKSFPILEGKPGTEVEINVNDLPDIPGYDKPKGDKDGKIKVTIPEAGKSVDLPYTPKKNTTPSRPVDKNTGKEIKTDKSFPILEGKPGDVIEIDVNDLPDIPGYNKPKGDKNGKIQVTIPESGMIDFGYTPIEAAKPGQPEQNNNGSKQTPEKTTPEKGKSKGDAAYPNTGSENDVLVSAAGAAMLALTGLFAGLTKRRKK